MGDTLPKFVAAAVQAAPVYLDREASVEKACELIRDAGRSADLIVFPETWLPGYPFWHTGDQVRSPAVFSELWKNAIEIPSLSTEELCDAAADADAYVVIGLNERDTVARGTLYNTLLYISPDGRLLHRHRKLVPSFTERTIWAMGDGSDLDVLETAVGRLGGLICWEHIMPLARFALMAQGEQVHCGAWPAYSFQRDHIDAAMRDYAFCGATFVISACGVVTPGSMPAHVAIEPSAADGGSAIIGPDGKYLAGPVFGAEETLFAEIDLERTLRERHSRDVAGHYARPDVLHLVVNGNEKHVATFERPHGVQLPDTLETATAHEVVDRLEAVRDYLGSLIERIGADGDAEMEAALTEAIASIEEAAALRK